MNVVKDVADSLEEMIKTEIDFSSNQKLREENANIGYTCMGERRIL